MNNTTKVWETRLFCDVKILLEFQQDLFS